MPKNPKDRTHSKAGTAEPYAEPTGPAGEKGQGEETAPSAAKKAAMARLDDEPSEHAFGQASNPRTHVRTVHEQRKDHACPQCDAAFGQAGNLRKHVRTVHKQREEEEEVELLLFMRTTTS